MRGGRLAALVLVSLVCGASGCSGCFDLNLDLGLGDLFQCPPGCQGSVPGGRRACSALGTCIVQCGGGRANCDQRDDNGCEVDTSSDPVNCGACGYTCSGGTCIDAICYGETDAAPPPIDELVSRINAPLGLAVDGRYVYYTDTGAIFRIPRDGGGAVRLAAGQAPLPGLATDGVVVAWTNGAPRSADGGDADGGDAGVGDAAGPGVYRVQVDGGGLGLVGGADPAAGVGVASGAVYFLERRDGGTTLVEGDPDGGLSALADLDGTRALTQPFSLGGGAVVAIDGERIARVPLDGGAKRPLADAGGAVAVVAGDGDSFFYVAPRDGGASFDLVAPGQGAARLLSGTVAALAFEGGDLYVANDAVGSIDRFDASDVERPATQIASAQPGILAFAVDDAYVYWITRALPHALRRAPRGP